MSYNLREKSASDSKSVPATEESLIQRVIEKALTSDKFISELCNKLFEAVSDKIQTYLHPLDEKITRLETALADCSKNAELKIDKLEQYSRRNNLRVYGIKEGQGEKTNELLCKIFKDKLDVNIMDYNIDRSHRLPNRNMSRGNKGTFCAPIIIKFNNYDVKDAVYKNKSRFKGTNIVVKEDLTTMRLNLYRLAVQRFSTKSVWTRDGIIHVKLKDRVHKLSCIDELNELK